MAIHLQPTTLQLFPEEYIIEEDLAEMGDSNPHTRSGDDIDDVLRWHYRLKGWLVFKNVNLYHPAILNSRHYIVPDVMLIKMELPPDEGHNISSWQALRQAPAVVFEISSEGIWSQDIGNGPNDKPAIYGRIGVKEYFAYDPQHPPLWSGRYGGRRLVGWRYDETGQPSELVPDSEGRLWSEELACYLVEDGYYLAFVDENGQRFLTESQSERQARQVEEAARRAEEVARQQAELRVLSQEAARQVEEVAKQQVQKALEAETVARQQAELRAQTEEAARQQAELRAQTQEAARQALEQQVAELLKKLEGKE